jgi:hypothetical protein
MNPKDTDSLDEDDHIEMIRLKHTRPYTQLNMEESDSEDGDDPDREDSSETLLSPTHGGERLVHPPPKRWPQMKNIVVEVRVHVPTQIPILISLTMHRARQLSY